MMQSIPRYSFILKVNQFQTTWFVMHNKEDFYTCNNSILLLMDTDSQRLIERIFKIAWYIWNDEWSNNGSSIFNASAHLYYLYIIYTSVSYQL